MLCIRVILLLVSVISILLLGCGDAGIGGTGELVVPRRELRDIESRSMNQLAVAPPATGPVTRPSVEEGRQIELTIEQARRSALENNLELKVDLLNPTIARQSITEEQARYEAVFTTNADYSTFDRPSNFFEEGGNVRDRGNQGNNFSLTPGIRKPLLTGGDIALRLPFARDESQRFDPAANRTTDDQTYTTSLAATISQPLLRGAGVYVNAQPIRVAFYQYQQSQAQTKLEIIRVLADADRAYWRVYAARRQLVVRKQEYDLAQAQLDRARRQVRIGAAAEVEIVRAESGVADTLEAIIIADNALRDRQRELKRILNRPDLPLESDAIVIPVSEPTAVFYKLDRDQLMRTAMEKRMELLQTELQIALASSQVTVARNELLPLVLLSYTYNVNAIGDAPDEAFTVLTKKHFEDHRLGLTVEVPIGNQAAQARLRRALAARVQEIATKEQQAQLIHQEVLSAVDQLEANWQRIIAAQSRVALNTRLVEVETRQFNQGLRTSTDVLNAQTNLANAASSEIVAITEYQIAQVDIAFATGMLLGAAHITWDNAPTPQP